MGGNQPETVDFTLNPAVRKGRYDLTVVGAGIASEAVYIEITPRELMENRGTAAQLPGAASTLAGVPAASSTPARTPVKLVRIPKPIHRQN